MTKASLINRFGKSLGHAFDGLRIAAKTELHFRYHLIAVVLVMALALITPISRLEWIIIAVLIGNVLMAELFNTALEHLVDLASPQQQVKAGRIKDLAAGAVLIMAIVALVIAAVIFIPKYFVL